VTAINTTAQVLYSSTATGQTGFTATSTQTPLIDLTAISDVALSVNIPENALTGTDPTITVQLDCQDAAGNWVPAVVTTGPLSAAGQTQVCGGLLTSKTVLSESGRITVTLGGATPAATGIGISLIGR
jgi:hypothetical protein